MDDGGWPIFSLFGIDESEFSTFCMVTQVYGKMYILNFLLKIKIHILHNGDKVKVNHVCFQFKTL